MTSAKSSSSTILKEDFENAQGGLSALAEKTHLNRQNLYNVLSKKGNPRLDTFGLIIKGLGFKLALAH